MPTIYTSIDKKNPLDLRSLPQRREFDFYPTPIEICKEAILKIPYQYIHPNIRVLDPGAGNGVWGRAMREIYKDFPNIVGVELRDVDKPEWYNRWYKQTDFLENYKFGLDFYLGFDIIIGNPPYKYGEKFLDKSFSLLRTGGYLLFLLKLNILESKKRYDKYFNSGLNPQEVYVSVRRVSFTGNKKSNADAYGIFLWQRGWKGDTTLKWLDWNYND